MFPAVDLGPVSVCDVVYVGVCAYVAFGLLVSSVVSIAVG